MIRSSIVATSSESTLVSSQIIESSTTAESDILNVTDLNVLSSITAESDGL